MGTYDFRFLGLCLRSLTISDDPARSEAIALDDPRLVDGFHRYEDGARRWTDGDAKLPASLWRGRERDFCLTIALDGPPVPRWVAPVVSVERLREGCAA